MALSGLAFSPGKFWGQKKVAFIKGLWPKRRAYGTLRKIASRETYKGLVLWRLAFERSALLVTFVDKVAVRDFVRRASPDTRLPTVYQVVSSAKRLDPSLWPSECVVKPSHGSGALIMITAEKRENLRFAIPRTQFRWDDGIWGMTSESLDTRTLQLLGSQWVKSNFEYWTPKYPEWAYRHVPRKILVEQLITGTLSHPVVEARLHCFHGVVRLCRVTDVLSAARRAWTLTPQGEVLDAWLESDPIKELSPFDLPPMWQEAIRQASLLSRNIDYVRVDLYLTESEVYFSELTPYPNGGNADFEPRELSELLAREWVDPESHDFEGRLSQFLAHRKED